jgi:hypothetical protein
MDVVGSIDPLYVLSGFCVGALVGNLAHQTARESD